MCDYSLMGVPNRLASCGEELVVRRFHTGTMGLAPYSDLQPVAQTQHATFWEKLNQHFMAPQPKPSCAVCVPPGAQLMLENIPQVLQNSLRVGAAEAVTFTQIGAEPYTHRDAVMFRNGRTLLLQHLQEGQRVRVLQLAPVEVETPARGQWEQMQLR